MGRLHWRIRRTASSTRCETKMRGVPLPPASAATPGEKAMILVNRPPLTVPSESAYEAPHSGKGLAELGCWLFSMASAASTVAVAIEVPHRPVVDALIDRGFVVYATNPKQLDRLRDRFSVAGAKDDRRDA